MIEVITICWLFLASNGDIFCRCEEQPVPPKANVAAPLRTGSVKPQLHLLALPTFTFKALQA